MSVRPWLFAALCAASCRTQVEEGSEGGVATKRGHEKIALTCRPAADLDEAAQAEIEQASRALFDALRAGDTDALWAALHPQARDGADKEAFVASLNAISGRLADTGPPTEEWAWAVDVRGGINDLGRVTCGDGEPPALTWMANVGGEDLAAVSLLAERAPFSYATTLQLRRRGKTWRLLGVQANPARYRGKGADDYEALAAQYAETHELVAAYLMLGIARTLAERGASLKTDDAVRLQDALDRIGRTDGFVAETEKWDVGGDTFDILGLTLMATQDDLSLVVKYVNDQGLVEELLGRDADKLMDHVRTRFPELRERFDAVVFEAYPARPTDDGGQVQAYRTVRMFAGPSPTAGPTPSPGGAPSGGAAPPAPPPTP